MIAFLGSASATNDARPGKDFAIFFANDDYSQNPEFANLRNPVRDARAIAKEMEEIYAKLGEWQRKSFEEDGQLFIFFSGHGTFWEFVKKGYYVPKGSQMGHENYIELTNLGNIVTNIRCNHILLAVDACYSGTIDPIVAFRGSVDRRPESIPLNRDNLLKKQLRNKSQLFITSGGKVRTSDGENHSPFAEAILEGLRNSYTNEDGYFTFSDLTARLERIEPVPHQGTLMEHGGGGFVFVSNDAERGRSNIVVNRNREVLFTWRGENPQVIKSATKHLFEIDLFTFKQLQKEQLTVKLDGAPLGSKLPLVLTDYSTPEVY